jgi:hypothetical protein
MGSFDLCREADTFGVSFRSSFNASWSGDVGHRSSVRHLRSGKEHVVGNAICLSPQEYFQFGRKSVTQAFISRFVAIFLEAQYKSKACTRRATGKESQC